ncbi:MAG: DUF4148 domain-containing protein [Paraburkholderia sp.]|jgi:hypothetical protein|nr:DUF4148 domain-containing protein [Paraburkholderia sp.]
MTLVRSLVAAATVAAAVAVPTLSFAQTDHALTRAEVRAELVQLQQAGYRPVSDNTQYPANLQAALARIDAGQQGAAAAYGGTASGRSAAGERAPQAPAPDVTRASGAQPDVVGLEPIYGHS